MIFIVEGPDKAGKTTFINTLIKEFPGILLKITDRPQNSNWREQDKIRNHYSEVRDFMNNSISFGNFILDRYYPSEMVYGVKRGYEVMDDPFFFELEQDLIDKHGRAEIILLLCDPGEEEIISRIRKEADDYVTEKENLQMLTRYRKMFNQSQISWKFKIDTSRPAEELIQEIKNQTGLK